MLVTKVSQTLVINNNKIGGLRSGIFGLYLGPPWMTVLISQNPSIALGGSLLCSSSALVVGAAAGGADFLLVLLAVVVWGYCRNSPTHGSISSQILCLQYCKSTQCLCFHSVLLNNQILSVWHTLAEVIRHQTLGHASSSWGARGSGPLSD